LARALLSGRCLRLISDTLRWIDKGVWMRSGTKWLTMPAAWQFARKLTHWHKELRKKAGKFAELDALERHQLRFRTKKLRYAIEFFGDLFPQKHPSRRRAMLQYLAKAQESLGELNDSVRAQVLESNMNQGKECAAGRSLVPVRTLSRKRKKHLERAAGAAFCKMAELKSFWN
jgi:triphosphatase